ncbi:hypothetical protein CAPTEDRAFT_216741 [Capitella teleta]|uniref:Mitochondria-eating protein n=1 Tax=Capitella teleta TaxID=283909 RepID=R7TSU4_CAPTE|nr:hypothetical protein CAPTEDRAFT_216741 [Capitella teleta]|eukprot:ELT96677.1 hypothetical protein CAPTEDRAFT_216741 [Capitella teleta]
MGGKESKPSKGDDVTMRNKKKKKGGKERPLSDPGIYAGSPPIPQPEAQDFSRSSVNQDLSGKHRSQSQNPLMSADDVITNPPVAIAFKSNAKPHELDLFQEAVEQVLLIWPEYHHLKKINKKSLDEATITTITQISRRIIEQHKLLQTLSEEKRTMQRKNAATMDEKERLEHRMNQQEIVIAGLKQDVIRLEEELDEHSDIAAPLQEAQLPTRNGIYAPTPLLQATKDRNPVTRTRSLNPVTGKSNAPTRTGSFSGVDREIERLKAALEQERTENQKLKAKITKSDPFSISAKSLDPKRLVDRFKELEYDALEQGFYAVSNIISHKAYLISQRTVVHFKGRMHHLIAHPVDALFDPSTEEDDLKGKPNQLQGKIKQFEEKKMVSKLALRTQQTGEIPDMILKQITTFLQSTSNVTNLSLLIEAVLETLREDFPECTVPAVIGNSTFDSFLRDCCRLSWEMCVQSPPLQVSTLNIERFDDRFHETYQQDHVTNARIDYYVWPALCSHRHGDLLRKGRTDIRHCPDDVHEP